MDAFKAPRPDGFQPVFYQQCWEVVGELVIRFVLDFFTTNQLPSTANNALVVRKESRNFDLISLCNVLFKTITKTMVNRLKVVISKLVGPAQASFIPRRLSAV
ncbi:hypothetical protein V2J09_000169 [Rumex salicifolius]